MIYKFQKYYTGDDTTKPKCHFIIAILGTVLSRSYSIKYVDVTLGMVRPISLTYHPKRNTDAENTIFVLC